MNGIVQKLMQPIMGSFLLLESGCLWSDRRNFLIPFDNDTEIRSNFDLKAAFRTERSAISKIGETKSPEFT